MIAILFFLISLFASSIGSICGVGGGIVIKPVLDATHAASIATISFLSACTVLCMSTTSVIRNRKEKDLLDYRISTALAIGAVVGGVLGKALFNGLDMVIGGGMLGGVQAVLLFLVLAFTLSYSFIKERISTHHIENTVVVGITGVVLGGISAFLGIGGGPIELMALSFLFSMDSKKAAANSLYIIMFSQIAAVLQTVVSGALPPFDPLILVLMGVAGIVGGLMGSAFNKKISVKGVEVLYRGLLAVVLAICVMNVIGYFGS
ncbi:MAG: sulfite exporter TauE/SafE family protein [Eggerthellaceae bacterium]